MEKFTIVSLPKNLWKRPINQQLKRKVRQFFGSSILVHPSIAYINETRLLANVETILKMTEQNFFEIRVGSVNGPRFDLKEILEGAPVETPQKTSQEAVSEPPEELADTQDAMDDDDDNMDEEDDVIDPNEELGKKTKSELVTILRERGVTTARRDLMKTRKSKLIANIKELS